jgi:hypothetical protein
MNEFRVFAHGIDFDPDAYIRLADEYDYYMGVMEMESEYKKAQAKRALLDAAK